MMKFLMFSLFLSMGVLTDTHSWELVKETDGIQVYNRKVEGYKIKEYKAEMIIDEVYYDKLWDVLKDVEAYDKWVYKCAESILIKKEGENILYTYHRHSAPWPTRDRDNGAKMIYTKNDDHFTVQVLNEPNIVPEKDKLYRIQHMRANWRIEKIGNGKIKVTEIVWFDPGSIPAFIVNMVTTDSPYQTFHKLRTYMGVK
jgi:ribosome-associated toxin RatA of RatAB toxin-antitoxin module